MHSPKKWLIRRIAIACQNTLKLFIIFQHGISWNYNGTPHDSKLYSH